MKQQVPPAIQNLIDQVMKLPKKHQPNMLNLISQLTQQNAPIHDDQGRWLNNPVTPNPNDWQNGFGQIVGAAVGDTSQMRMPIVPAPQIFSQDYMKDVAGPLLPTNPVVPRQPMNQYNGGDNPYRQSI